MVALSKSRRNQKISYRSKLRSAALTTKDNDTARIRACVDARAPTSEVVEEAYRLCRINNYIRKDLQKAKDDLRLADEFNKRRAVREDALKEMREDLLKTQKMLERTWGYMEYRNVKVPADMKAEYKVLRAQDLHDWQQQKGMKNNGTQPLQGKKSTNTNRKQKQKAKKEKASVRQTTFLLHTDEGTTRNLRDPVIDSYTDEDTDDEAELPPAEAGVIAADGFSKELQGPHEQIMDNVVACSKPEPSKINPFATLKKPTIVASSSGNSTIFMPIVEGAFGANNVIASVKRKNTSINDSTSGAMKKARLHLDFGDVTTGATGSSDKTANSETTMTPGGSNHCSTEETRCTTPEITAVAPTPLVIKEDLEEGEIDERGLVHSG